MIDLPIDDSASVLDEGCHGWAPPIDTSGDYKHLPPAERRAAKKRSYERKQRWALAQAIRAEWTEEDYATEEARLRAEIEAWERRNAA